MQSNLTIAQLRSEISAHPRVVNGDYPLPGLSKMRKAELSALLAELTDENEAADMTGHWAEQGAGVDPETAQPFKIGTKLHEQAEAYDAAVGEPQVYQGAMHEAEAVDVAAVDALIGQEFGDVAVSLRGLADATRALVEPLSKAFRASAQAVGRVAWANMRATVTSMGHTVRGRVVDTVLRTPDANGGRVCLVVEHAEQAIDWHGVRTWEAVAPGYARRTLHRLVDVDLTPLTS